MDKKFMVALGLLLATVSTNAMAEEGMGFIRGEVGSTKMKAVGESGSETSFGARGGYFFNANFGAEGFYTNYGDDDGAKVDGFGAGLIGKHNFGGVAHTGGYISGRAGVARTKLSVSGLGSVSETAGYVGIGGGYDFSRNLGIGLNYDYQQPKFGDVVRVKLETVTFSVEYRF
jgi:opacity protein-like surface antigen